MKNFLIFHAVRAALFVTARIPVRLVSPLGTLIGRGALFLARFERKVAEKQLDIAYQGISAPRRNTLISGLSRSLGRGVIEAARLLRPKNRLPDVRLGASSRAALDNALAVGRGVIFVTGHLGNWELMAAWLAAEGYPIHTVVRASYDHRFTRLIDAGRRRRGIGTIFRGQKGAAAAMLRVLKNGGVLGMLIDQDTDAPSIFVPFFGQQAKTPVGPAVLADRYGAPLVVGTIHRQPAGGHRIEIERCRASGDVTSVTARLTWMLEQRIRRRPSQWVWFHRRWRSAAEGGMG